MMYIIVKAAANALKLVRDAVKLVTNATYFVTDAPNLTICKTRANKLEWYDLTATSTGTPNGNSTSPAAGSALFTSFSKFVLANKIGGNNPLPVELISFNAISGGMYNNIFWESAMEVNFKHYELESSEDGTNFIKIYTVAPLQNLSSYNNYNYLDFNFFKPITYYRLKMVDLDYSFKYSNIVSVEYGINKTEKLVVYPNPASNELFVLLAIPNEKDALIDIKDILGRTVYQQKIDLNQGFEIIYINSTDFAAGTYIVNVTCGNSFIQTIKVIITNKY